MIVVVRSRNSNEMRDLADSSRKYFQITSLSREKEERERDADVLGPIVKLEFRHLIISLGQNGLGAFCFQIAHKI